MDALLEATARAEARHFWFVGFRSFVQPLLDEACASRSGLRLLDCGCGTGSNLAMLGQRGLAFGIDLNARGLVFATESGHARLARATVEALPFPDEAFDVVTSFAVRTVQRLAGPATPEEAGLEITTPPAPVNAVLARALKLEARALRRVNMPFGSSLPCLARRRMEVSARPDRAADEPSGHTP